MRLLQVGETWLEVRRVTTRPGCITCSYPLVCKLQCFWHRCSLEAVHPSQVAFQVASGQHQLRYETQMAAKQAQAQTDGLLTNLSNASRRVRVQCVLTLGMRSAAGFNAVQGSLAMIQIMIFSLFCHVDNACDDESFHVSMTIFCLLFNVFRREREIRLLLFLLVVVALAAVPTRQTVHVHQACPTSHAYLP